jgi:hypothetical protein
MILAHQFSLDMHPNGTCPNCGGKILGDGYRTVLHCEIAEVPDDVEPDAMTIHCEPISRMTLQDEATGLGVNGT